MNNVKEALRKMLIVENRMRNIVAALIYSDNTYTMYSIITKDYVVQFNDEGYASSPLLRVVGSKGGR